MIIEKILKMAMKKENSYFRGKRIDLEKLQDVEPRLKNP